MDETIIKEHVPLGPLTTLGVGGSARYFCEVKTIDKLKKAVCFSKQNTLPFRILGGGSNVVVDDNGFPGLVIRPSLLGITFREQPSGVLLVEVGAGERWDDVVKKSIDRSAYGIENLSFIPGSAGAAPVQNIGCYGQELADTLVWVEVYDTKENKILRLSKDECRFSYRDSIFKHSEGLGLVVTKIALALFQNGTVNISYKDLGEYFSEREITTPSLLDIRRALAVIRKRKFGSLRAEGTAGSFFKNPIISKLHYRALQKTYPGMPGFLTKEGYIKVPLAWILDHVCGLKGFKRNGVSLYKNQPLVLTVEKNVRSREINMFAHEIEKEVKNKTNIVIEREVQNFL